MSEKALNVFITGATGFIGKALAFELVKEGHLVTLLIRSEEQKQLFQGFPFKFVKGDLADEINYKETLSNCDLVVHAASIRNRWNTDASIYEKVNVKGTGNLLKSAIGRVKRFVYISSVGVYGFPGNLGINENSSLISNPEQIDYHTSKIMAEKLVRHATEEMETVIIRPTITYGPGDKDGMLTKLILMINKGANLQIGAGKNYIHLTYIDDLIKGVKLAAFKPEAAGQEYILAGPSPIQIKDLSDLILKELNIKRKRLLIPKNLAEISGNIFEWLYGHNLPFLSEGEEPPITLSKVNVLAANRSFSAEKAGKALGYIPLIDYQVGIRRTISWLKMSKQLS